MGRHRVTGVSLGTHCTLPENTPETRGSLHARARFTNTSAWPFAPLAGDLDTNEARVTTRRQKGRRVVEGWRGYGVLW